jgi:NAD(P)-dependent dehydrogenase (short-subunit alcohol dehydrogenase family)
VQLAGRVAIVTGGAAGLGALLTRALAEAVATVVVADVDVAAGERLAREVHGRFVATDLCDDAAVLALVERAATEGPLGLVVNNAGGWSPGDQFPEARPQDWARTLRLNLGAPMLLTQRSLDPMAAAGGGAVVLVSSSGALEPNPYGSPEYAAAKAGLVRFTGAFAATAAERGVRVSCVVPHWIGLPRAHAELARLSPAERAASGGLVDPVVVVDEVLRLATAGDSAGQVRVIRPERPPYPLDLHTADPHVG